MILGQDVEPFPGRDSEEVIELVEFREKPGIGGIAGDGLFQARHGSRQVVFHPRIGEAEVPMGSGVCPVQPDGFLPFGYRRFGLAVKKKVPEIIRSTGILGIFSLRPLQDGDILEAERKAIIGRHSHRLLKLPLGPGLIPRLVIIIG
jgi:hypothetical protein